MTINWQPFAYDIAVGIRIGVAFVLGSGDTSQALTIEIGAQLHLWGPPFGGIATISLYVISFDIAFGEPQQPVLEKVDWKTFHQSFLPQAPEADADPLLGSIRITAGLIKVQDVTKNGQKTKLNVVNAHELQFTTESVVPATSVLLNNKAVESSGVAAKAARSKSRTTAPSFRSPIVSSKPPSRRVSRSIPTSTASSARASATRR